MKREGVNFSPFTGNSCILLLTQIVYDNRRKIVVMGEIMVINFRSKEEEHERLVEAFIREAQTIEAALLATPEAQAVAITDEERDAAYERLMQRVHEAANK